VEICNNIDNLTWLMDRTLGHSASINSTSLTGFSKWLNLVDNGVSRNTVILYVSTFKRLIQASDNQNTFHTGIRQSEQISQASDYQIWHSKHIWASVRHPKHILTGTWHSKLRQA